MRRHLGLILWLLMTLACSAAETVAWKVPLSRFAETNLETEGVVRCKSAPEHSPFFKEGDELWDLKAVVPIDERTKQKFRMEYLMWNASSGRLVAKGGWSEICALNMILRPDDLTKHCRLTVSLYDVAADGAPINEGAKPAAELSMVARPGQISTATSWSEQGITITIRHLAVFIESESIVDVRIGFFVKVPEQAGMEVDTGFTLESGKALWVARDFDGKHGLDVKFRAAVEELDGTPLRERVMIQKGKQAAPLLPERTSLSEAPRRIGEAGWLLSRWVSPHDLTQFLSPASASDNGDPFAESARKERAILPPVPILSPPELLRPWLDHEVLDAGEWVEKLVRPFEPNLRANENFIGYDPMLERLYFYSPQRELVGELVEILDQVFVPPCDHRPRLLVANLEGNGQTRLVAKSGQKAVLSRTVGEKSVQRSMEIEPTVDGSEDLMDMRLDYLDEADPKRSIRLKTGVTLNVGKSLELMSGTAGDGKKSTLRMTAEVLQGHRGEGE